MARRACDVAVDELLNVRQKVPVPHVRGEYLVLPLNATKSVHFDNAELFRQVGLVVQPFHHVDIPDQANDPLSDVFAFVPTDIYVVSMNVIERSRGEHFLDDNVPVLFIEKTLLKG